MPQSGSSWQHRGAAGWNGPPPSEERPGQKQGLEDQVDSKARDLGRIDKLGIEDCPAAWVTDDEDSSAFGGLAVGHEVDEAIEVPI
ncbi:hypothetical protein AK812_SmicGene14299 [Symbiodinium microadriaticum]|uniref:Uncharacterized protein n=1 Tax=Symbiodinium microadriaticum TaxID=2951 RepID=A0A1Q9E5T7_SYMMI|nr:hypothetical protein AK812_SmicGene14299 [Symbiodinium microadriaticum]